MSIINSVLQRTEIWGVIPVNRENTEFEYLLYCLNIINQNISLVQKREILSIIAEIYYKDSLEQIEKEYLYNTFLKFNFNENNYFVLTELEKRAELDRELWVAFP